MGSEAAVKAAYDFQPGVQHWHGNFAARGHAPSMDESEQIARKVMNDCEMKLELTSEAVGQG